MKSSEFTLFLDLVRAAGGVVDESKIVTLGETYRIPYDFNPGQRPSMGSEHDGPVPPHTDPEPIDLAIWRRRREKQVFPLPRQELGEVVILLYGAIRIATNEQWAAMVTTVFQKNLRDKHIGPFLYGWLRWISTDIATSTLTVLLQFSGDRAEFIYFDMLAEAFDKIPYN